MKDRARKDFKTLLQQPDRDVANQRSGQRLLASTASSVSHHVAQDNMVEQTRCAPLLFAPVSVSLSVHQNAGNRITTKKCEPKNPWNPF